MASMEKKFNLAYHFSWAIEIIFFFEIGVAMLFVMIACAGCCKCKAECFSCSEWMEEGKAIIKYYSTFN